MADPTPAPAPNPAPAPEPTPTPEPTPEPAPPAPEPANPDTLFKGKQKDEPAPKPDDKPTDQARPEWLPEKYAVLKDGKLDLEASAQKLAEGYANASKKIGKGEAPPAKPEDYTFTPPEAFKDVPLDAGLTKEFRERAHKKGLNQEQFEFVMGEYFGQLPALLNGAAKVSADEARNQLQAVWKDPKVMQSNMDAAERAVALMPEGLQEQIYEKYGTDPVFWQFAAQFGREAREDTPPKGNGGQAPVTDVEALERSDAYRNPKHADHAKVSAQVRKYYEKRAGTAPAIF